MNKYIRYYYYYYRSLAIPLALPAYISLSHTPEKERKRGGEGRERSRVVFPLFIQTWPKGGSVCVCGMLVVPSKFLEIKED